MRPFFLFCFRPLIGEQALKMWMTYISQEEKLKAETLGQTVQSSWIRFLFLLTISPLNRALRSRELRKLSPMKEALDC